MPGRLAHVPPMLIMHVDRKGAIPPRGVTLIQQTHVQSALNLTEASIGQNDLLKCQSAPWPPRAIGVGDCKAQKKSLPALFRFAAGSFSPEWTKPSPRSNFLCEDGRYKHAMFCPNEKGGVVDDLGVTYLRDVVAPCFSDRTASIPVVLLCDGRGSYRTLQLIEWCRVNNSVSALRFPHTSQIPQGEDFVIFKGFEPVVRTRKVKVFSLINIDQSIFKLHAHDLIRCVCPAWEAAFSTENIVKSFSHMGVVPLTRCVLLMLMGAERLAEARCSKTDSVDYSRLSVGNFTWRMDADNEEDADDEHSRLVAKGMISLAGL